MPSRLERAIAEHRAAIRSIDRSALANVMNEYERIMQRLNGQIEALQQAAIRNGVSTPSELFRMDRYHELQRQIATEMQTLAEATGDITAQAQARATLESLQSAERMALSAPSTRAGVATVQRSWVNVDPRAVEDFIGASRSGPLAELLATFEDVTAKTLTNEITNALATGAGPSTVADAMRKSLDISRNRAMTIARTEMMRASRSATLAQYAANDDVLQGWIWSSARDGTCAACLAMDGTTHPQSEPMDSHVNCFVAGTMVNGPKAVAGTARWYSGDVIEIETEFGRWLTVTPNHPILTTEGWIAAGLLNKSNHLVSGAFGQVNSVASATDYDNVPARIEEVARSLRGSDSVISVRVPTAAEYFHGDGEGSDVYVVRANGLLLDRFYSTGGKRISQNKFERGGMGGPFLPSLSRLGKLLDRADSAARRFMCRSCQSLSILGTRLSHPQEHAFALGAGCYSGVEQVAPNRTANDSVRFGERLLRLTTDVSSDHFVRRDRSESERFDSDSTIDQDRSNRSRSGLISAADLRNRLAGLVTPDHIVSVNRKGFTGHVYNLQTVEGWYFANGIISHNCRCSPIPWLRDIPMQKVETGSEWLAGQKPDVQDSVLGKAGGQAFRAGDVRLPDFVRTTESAEWGKSIGNGGIGWARTQAGSEGAA